MYQMLRDKNNGLSADAVQFAADLIKTPSISLREEKAAELVEKEMIKVGFDKVFRDGAGNVIGIIHGRQPNPVILLTSHLDTIDPRDENGWNNPPFSGMIKNGNLYGRGSCDCKGGVAAQVYAGALLKRSLLPMKGTLVVAATVAEENGLSMGTRFLLNETLPSLSLKPDFAVMGEPTNLGVYYGHDGWMEVNIKLESANAFEIEDAVEVVSEEMLSEYPGQIDWKYIFNKTYFNTLEKEKQAILQYRSRLYTDSSPESIVSRIEKRAESAARLIGPVAVNAYMKEENQEFYTGRNSIAQYQSKAWTTDPFHPMVQRSCQALEAAGMAFSRSKWKLEKPGMGTSGGVILNEFSIPVIGYGPGREEDAHIVNECLSLENLTEAVYGTAVIAHSLAGIPVCGWTIDEI
jgi:acetylornithine deacetylase/succinyl-diaminopimelate desuccinylase-like protein